MPRLGLGPIVYTKLLYNLSKYVGMSGDDEEAIRFCDLGIKACIRYNRYDSFIYLLYNKGYGLMNLGRTEESHKCIQESYYIQRAIGETEEADMGITVEFANKHGIKLL